MAVERPYKYEVKAKITSSHDIEPGTQIVPEIPITGDLDMEYDEATGMLIVFTNKKQKGLQEIEK